MIYLSRAQDDPLYQGDIFTGVPFAEFSILDDFATLDGKTVRWLDHLTSTDEPLIAAVQLRPVTAMVISQDCDVARSHGSATLALVDRFREVHRAIANTTSANEIQKHITKLSNVNVKWFYLPPDPGVGFAEKMACDFETTISVAVADLQAMRSRRIAGLIDYARDHLRHRVAHFFERYGVDEWYALDAEEMRHYMKQHQDAAPYPWQPDIEEPSEKDV